MLEVGTKNRKYFIDSADQAALVGKEESYCVRSISLGKEGKYMLFKI